MDENKKTFIFYSDWVNMIREMPDEDAGQLLKHILSYVNDENPETKNILVKMAFGHMKPLLKSDLQKWHNIREKRRLAGKKGGQANAKQNQANAKQLEAVNDNVNDNVNGNKKKSIEERKTEFYNSLPSFINGNFTKQDARDFFEYWTEHGLNDRKMRFEKEKAFALDRRVKTWLKNKNEFGPKEKPQTVSFKNKI